MEGFSKVVTLTVLIGSLAGFTAACGSSPHQATEQNTVAPTASPSPSEHKVGDTVTVSHGDTRYDVTLMSVADPASPASEYSTPPSGHHFAAAQFRVTAHTAVDENANNNASLIGSDEQVYTSTFAQLSEGTNFADGSVRLQPGTSLVGWVAFDVPNQVRAAKVRWSPGSGFGGNGAEWTVNTTTSGSGTSPAASPTSSPAASPTATAPAQASDPENTVIEYFDAINNHNFRRAWELGGKNTTSSYSSFVDGFSTTAWAGVEILDLSGDIGTAVVTARLTTLETDGTSKVFQGEYTVRGGVITEFRVHQVS